jgi:hypothetical protein
MKLFDLSASSSAGQSPIDVVLGRLPSRPKRSSGRWVTKCPAHDDRNPSLSIAMGRDGRVLLKCFAGCSTESILDALGLRWGDLFDGERDERRWTDGR